MILLHVKVQQPSAGEPDNFEGHQVCVLLPTEASEEERDLLRRFVNRATNENKEDA